jgi:hypothetical protein
MNMEVKTNCIPCEFETGKAPVAGRIEVTIEIDPRTAVVMDFLLGGDIASFGKRITSAVQGQVREVQEEMTKLKDPRKKVAKKTMKEDSGEETRGRKKTEKVVKETSGNLGPPLE